MTVYSRKILLACVALVACERARKAPDDAAPPPIDLPPRTEALELVIVFDLSKSMEENDLPPDRLDATRAALRAFAATRTRDRIGVVIYAQQPKLVLAPTADLKAVDAVLARLKIGDVPELGTAMGDGLALAVEQLPRSKAKRAVILTTDGDTNWVTRYDPAQAADLAKAAGITVHTVLVGSNQPTAFGTVSVNPVPVKQVATTTGGLFVQATDPAAFKAGLAAISAKLDAR